VWLLCAVAVAVGPSCHRLGVYACESDANCVDGDKRGMCEATGWCAYPDPSCEETGRRYDDLAGGGLAGKCVEPDPLATTTGTTGTATLTRDDATDTSASTGDPIPTCADSDGDGYGEGDACAGPDCDDDNPHTFDGCLYLGPEGDDESAGTRDAPWLTFARAVPELGPGSSLVLLPGTYVPDVHGSLFADCGADVASSGTADQPVFVRAEVERTAHLQTGGLVPGVELRGCTHWRVRGLHVSGDDVLDGSGSLVVLRDSTHVELRRLLLNDANRYPAGVLVYTPGSSELLLEDFEGYSFSGHGIYFTSPSNVLRRVYLHGRDRPDLPDCVPDGIPECTGSGGADTGLVIGDGAIVENVVIEHTTIGITGSSAENVTVLGSAVLDGVHGAVFGYDSSGYARSIRVENMIGVRLESRTVYLRSAADVTLRNITAIAASAFRADLDGTEPCPPRGCSLTGANLLAIDALDDGMEFSGTTGVVSHSNAIGSGGVPFRPDDEPIDDDEGLWRLSSSVPVGRIGVGVDECIVFVPDDSPMKGAGDNGEDIGANVLYRYENGVLGDVPLWDPDTGAFPCGAVVEGVNDDPSISCVGLHERLHVATDGCPLPAGYE
jgi:hypothetical protein